MQLVFTSPLKGKPQLFRSNFSEPRDIEINQLIVSWDEMFSWNHLRILDRQLGDDLPHVARNTNKKFEV